MSKRRRVIGPKMMEAVAFVQDNPGCTKHAVAVAVGPNGSNKWGDRAVWRAIKAGLINAEYSKEERRYYLTVLQGVEA